MTARAKPSMFSSEWLQRSARIGIVTGIGLVFLLAPRTKTWALCEVFSGAAQSQQPANTSAEIIQKEADAQLLEPGKPVEREIAGAETHFYRVVLAAGQFFHATFDQRGVNLLITLYGPDGKKIADFDSPNAMQGPEPVSVIADTSGTYRLEARTWQKDASKGRYSVKLEELRASTPRDAILVTAERGFAEATLTIWQLTTDRLRKAIEKYEEIIPMWRSLGYRQQEASTLTTIGYCHENLGEYEKALDHYNKAQALTHDSGDRGGEVLALYKVGSIYNEIGDPQKALDFYNQAMSINRVLNDKSMEANIFGNMGRAYSYLGEPYKALEAFNRSLPIKREVMDRSAESTLLNNIGLAHATIGEMQKALEYYNKALQINQSFNYGRQEGTTLNNIGTLYSDLGEYQKGLGFLEQALKIKQAAGNEYEISIALNNVGVAYSNLGDHQKALESYNQALPLTIKTKTLSIQATTLNNIGKAYYDLGDHQKALDFYNQSLSPRREARERRGESTTLNNIGRVYHKLGDLEKALGFYNQALQIRRDVSDRGGEILVLYNIANAQRDLGNLAEARSQIATVLDMSESLRAAVASQGLRTSYLASVHKYYELGADILMRLSHQRPSEGFAAAALQTSERSRARTLLESLAEARADIRQGAPSTLIERERLLQKSLAAKAEAQSRLLNSKHTPEQAAVMAKEVDALTTEYEEVQAEIRRTSPRYAALTQPAPLSLDVIQAETLDEDTMLLEYGLGEEKSYLWAVTKTSLESFDLPKRAEIEAAARKVYDILTTRNRSEPNETPEQRSRRIDLADAAYPKASADLSKMLLGPVAAQLGSRRLLIVSEGMLQYVPFAALPNPVVGSRLSVASGRKPATGKPLQGNRGAPQSNRQPTTDNRPLILDHEIINLPSISVLGALRRETAGRQAAAGTVAVLADPVFQTNDPRIGLDARNRSAVVDQASSSVNGDALRSASESGLDNFTRLRFSRQEADEIMRLAPGAKSFKALDFAASRATVTAADLDQYRIVHFATHGLINNLHPELSGIVLSLVDEQGRPQDGFLRLYDIYNLKLGADLVVLSACQTALGKEYKGEGLVGLTRGFMYAGAPRVVASLWQIDDRVTAELMKRFYQGVLGSGLRPAAALRAAQSSMWSDKRWQAPHNWAAFTFQGEWK